MLSNFFFFLTEKKNPEISLLEEFTFGITFLHDRGLLLSFFSVQPRLWPYFLPFHVFFNFFKLKEIICTPKLCDEK